MIKLLTLTWTMMMTITTKMVATKITKKAKPMTTTTTNTKTRGMETFVVPKEEISCFKTIFVSVVTL